jgi:multidrug resistance efflux pump
MKSVDENVACLLGFSPNYMSQTNISAPLLPQAQGNNTAGTSDDRELFARTEVQKASARLDVAEASLTAAEARLDAYCDSNSADLTSEAYSALVREVNRRSEILKGAQKNYDVQKASARLDVAEASLTAAEARLDSYCDSNSADLTSEAYSALVREVNRRSEILKGAQKNYSDALNGGIG